MNTKETLKPVLFMAVVAAVFTGAVAGVHMATRGRVALNRKLAETGVVLAVLGLEAPPAEDATALEHFYAAHVVKTAMDVRLPEDDAPNPVLAGYDVRDGERVLVGYAFRVGGRGFWDEIAGYVSFEPDGRTVKDVRFFKQNETPGLGARITTQSFREAFHGRVLPDEPTDGVLLEFVPEGRELGPSEVHAITGATQTSRAVRVFLNAYLVEFRKAMAAHESTALAQGGTP